MNPLLDSLSAELQLVKNLRSIVVAYSGGVDSHVLLHVCHQLRNKQPSLSIVAAYVDHGLQVESDGWREHCNNVCDQLLIPFKSVKVDARDLAGEGAEQAARNARYAGLQSLIHKNDVLLTAQHQDDQSETLMLQLLRGSGINGLAAMPKKALFSDGLIIRPFLSFSKETLVSYAEQHGLRWVEDPSNNDLNINRNYLRKKVIPVIKERWPSFAQTSSRTSQHCAEASSVLDNYIHQYINENDPKKLELKEIASLDKSLQKLICRRWLKLNGSVMPSTSVLQELIDSVIPAADDKAPILSWGDNKIRRYQGYVYILNTLPELDRSIVVSWSEDDCVLPYESGTLLATPSLGKGFQREKWLSSVVTIRFRQGGEKISLSDRQGRKSVKKLLNENAIPLWVRDRLPMIYFDDTLAAVADLWVAEDVAAKGEEESITIKWKRPAF